MTVLRPAELRLVERVMKMESGYVLDFTNQSFAEFFNSEMGVDIYTSIWSGNGESKANRLRAYLQIADVGNVKKLLSSLIDYRKVVFPENQVRDHDLEAVVSIVSRLEKAGGLAKTDAIDCFVADVTLEDLVEAIRREVNADKPQVALDRLHTYCMKKFAHLISHHDPGATPASTLNGRAGQYFNKIKKEAKTHRPVSFEIMSGTVKALERFNEVRNDHSLAHDNSLISKIEARFIFNAVENMLWFIKETEGKTFGR